MKRPLILEISSKPDKKLLLRYSDGKERLFDVKPYITGSWYGELEDDNYFKSVKIINDGRGIEWAHGQDIAPHELYELSTAID